VDNDSLVAALLADRDQYTRETPIVPSPDAIVVSGDLIQGAPVGHPEWRKLMNEQYSVAKDFLDHLARRFLAGDRSKLVIIPGNHDVCWNTSFSAMRRVPDGEYPMNLRAALVEPDSNYRWSWKERALYRIENFDAYQRRMDFYWDLVEDFYADVPLLRPIDRTRGYQLFEMHNRRIVVAAFESIHGNDCFGYAGALPRGAVARCDLDLRDIPHSYDLRVAVWHHSIQGPPLREDYMAINQIHEMVGLRFQLGLHGHQHVAAAETHYIHLNETQSMAVASAGSLCAGAKELPRGVNRQYNMIVIEDDFCRVRVHAREMGEGEQFTSKRNGTFADGFAELSWHAPVDSAGRTIDPQEENVRQATLRAEDALRVRDPRRAFEILDGMPLAIGSHARRIAIQAALEMDEPSLTVKIIGEPTTLEEAILLIPALVRLDNINQAAAILERFPDIESAIRDELKDKIEIKRAMKAK
jgi:3',5'-cyclic AMP phosphodiesterase CpdA